MKVMNTIKNTFIGIGIIGLSFSITSCGKGREEIVSVDNRPVVSVSLANVETASEADFITVSGKVQAEKSSTISSRLIGSITETGARVGEMVSAGQTLAVISSPDIQARIMQADAGILEAEASLNNILKDHQRIMSLFEKKSATQKELDDITAQKQMAEARVTLAKEMKNEAGAMLSYTVVKAPFKGVVSEKYVNIGDLTSPGKPMYSIESGASFQVEAMISEDHISSLKKGTQVKVTIKSDGSEIFGIINEKSNSSLNTGGQYLVKIDLKNEDVKDLDLLSGMYVNVLIPVTKTPESADNIMVDNKAIVYEGQLTGIYTVSESNTAILRWVRLGRTYGNYTEILSGLSIGERYIIDSESRLINGVRIETKN